MNLAGPGEGIWERFVVPLVGVIIIGFGPVLTITVDLRQGVLNLRYRSPFRFSTKSFSFDEIFSVNVAEDWEGERMYRLELILRSGEVVPLRMGYSIGKGRMERRAKRLRSAIGIGV
jgi:hypothetical protein